MSIYQKRFFTFLEQDEAADAQAAEAEAMQATLEPGTDAQDLGASAQAPNAAAAITAREQAMVDQINTWVAKLEEFTDYLNGTGPDSVQSTLKNAEPDTLLDKVRTTETKKIARAATDLAALVETLKGYLATSRDPKYRYQ